MDFVDFFYDKLSIKHRSIWYKNVLSIFKLIKVTYFFLNIKFAVSCTQKTTFDVSLCRNQIKFPVYIIK